MLAVFLVLWIILNERLTLEILWIGLIVSALVDLFCLGILGVKGRLKLPARLRLAVGGLRYVGYLLSEVFRCNMAVIRLIVSPRLEVEPELHFFRTRLRTDAGRVALANSITLTPGTYTVKLEGQEYAVHALDDSFQPGIEYSEFFRLAKKLEEH